MAEALRRLQAARLCSSQETVERAHSILRIATAKTRPGSGFVVNYPNALPAICAYLASEQLNNGEVSLQAATNGACISKSDFSATLKTVRAALRDEEEGGHASKVTYGALVETYDVHPADQAVACMEDTEGALSQFSILREKHGANLVSCAIFYWVCQLMEEPAVQERTLCQKYNLNPRAFKSMLATLDKHCELIAGQIKSYLVQAESSSTPRPKRIEKQKLAASSSTSKSPVKSAIKPRPQQKDSSTPTPTRTRSKRTVVFSRLPSGSEHDDNDDTFPETPTKKRKIDYSSPNRSRISASPTKPSTEAVAAFHAAMAGDPAKRADNTETRHDPDVGPSTRHRPHFSKLRDDGTHTPTTQSDAVLLPSPSRPRGSVVLRRRFRPVFLEQQQWYDRDPKVERIWADAKLNNVRFQ